MVLSLRVNKPTQQYAQIQYCEMETLAERKFELQRMQVQL
jgi:hypothetical protein